MYLVQIWHHIFQFWLFSVRVSESPCKISFRNSDKERHNTKLADLKIVFLRSSKIKFEMMKKFVKDHVKERKYRRNKFLALFEALFKEAFKKVSPREWSFFTHLHPKRFIVPSHLDIIVFIYCYDILYICTYMVP